MRYAVLRPSRGGIPADDVDFEMLNEQTMLRTEIAAIWARDGLRSFTMYGYRAPIREDEQTGDILTARQALDLFARYYGDVLLDQPLFVKRVDLVYTAYPSGSETCRLIPAWRLAVLPDDIDTPMPLYDFYRINAYTGEFLG